ncbi:MAG: hypothetical protein E7480_01290 [Ruminococcaceae bacterium]|nr:hypothetical protein [Oscillospiraceae bacterium]
MSYKTKKIFINSAKILLCAFLLFLIVFLVDYIRVSIILGNRPTKTAHSVKEMKIIEEVQGFNFPENTKIIYSKYNSAFRDPSFNYSFEIPQNMLDTLVSRLKENYVPDALETENSTDNDSLPIIITDSSKTKDYNFGLSQNTLDSLVSKVEESYNSKALENADAIDDKSDTLFLSYSSKKADIHLYVFTTGIQIISQ